MKARLMDKKQRGKWGEGQAANLLQQKGFSILHRNYRYGRSEIDLIAQKDKLVIFVEVKVRKDVHYGFPEATLSSMQANRIHRVATHYQQFIDPYAHIRFDIVSIRKSQSQWLIEHFEDAF